MCVCVCVYVCVCVQGGSDQTSDMDEATVKSLFASDYETRVSIYMYLALHISNSSSLLMQLYTYYESVFFVANNSPCSCGGATYCSS